MPTAPSSTRKSPQELRDAVNATLGKDTLTMASDSSFKVQYIPTGVLPFDILLQGGIPEGRFIQLHGDYSTLKSYLALNICKQVQLRGGTAAYIDTEHSFDPDWAESVGVNVSDLIVKRPATGEEAVDIMDVLIRAEIDFIAFDSVAAALPQAETQKRLSGESMQPGRLAQLMSAAMRRLTAANKKSSVLWINQTRQNIGITFGSNEALPGGKALPYYASYILSVRKTGKVTNDVKFYDGTKWATGKEQVGQKFKAEVIKSKLSKPFRDIWFTWDMNHGQLDLPGFLIAQGVELGLVEQKGNTWTCEGVRAIGREKFSNALAGSELAMLKLEDAIRDHHGLARLNEKQIKALEKKASEPAPSKTVAKPKLKSPKKLGK